MIFQEAVKSIWKKKTLILILVLSSLNIIFLSSKMPDSLNYSDFFARISSDQAIDSDKFALFEYDDKFADFNDYYFGLLYRNDIFTDIEEKLVAENQDLLAKKGIRLYQNQGYQNQFDRQIKINNALLDSNPRIMNDYLITEIESFDIILILSIILSVYLIYEIFYEAIDIGVHDLILTTKNGRFKLFMSRIIVFIISLLVFISLNKFIQILALIISKNSLATNIQTIEPLMKSSLSITYLQYFVLTIGITLLKVIFIGALFYFILNLIKNTVLSFTVLSLLFIISFILYYLISPQSTLAAIKYLNIYYLLIIHKLNQVYIGLFAEYFSFTSIQLLIFLIASIVLFIAGYLLSSKQLILNLKLSNKKHDLITTSNWMHNLQNLLVSNKLLLILILSISYSSYQYVNYKVVKTNDQMHFEEYQKSFLGVIDDKLMDKINQEEADIAFAEAEIQKIIDSNLTYKPEMNEEYLIMKKNDRLVFETVKGDVEQAKLSGSNLYMNDRGSKLLFFYESSFMFNIYLAMIIISGIIYSAVASGYESQRGLGDLIMTTKIGKYLHQRRKAFIANSLSVITIILIFALHYFKIKSNYHLSNEVTLLELLNLNSSLHINRAYILMIMQIIFMQLIINHFVRIFSRKYDYNFIIIACLVAIFTLTILSKLLFNFSLVALVSYSIFNNLKLIIFIDLLLILLISISRFKRFSKLAN